MEQKYLYLHTEKTLADTEEILKSEGMQIVFKSDYTNIKFSDMTEGEKLGWCKALEGNLPLQISLLEKKRKQFEKKIELTEKKLVDVFNLIKDVNTDNVDTKFEDIVKNRLNLGPFYVDMDLRRQWDVIDNGVTNSTINCSCLIAKTENDVVRYLSFLDDPVLSISGPTAANLKLSLEKQF